MAEIHTPGPLTIKPAVDSPAPDYAIISGHYVIGEAYRVLDKEARAPAKANATLWAAAPDLFEACTAVFSTREYIHLPDDVIWMLRDAIAKANGSRG